MTKCEAMSTDHSNRWHHKYRCQNNAKHEVETKEGITVHVCGTHKRTLDSGRYLSVQTGTRDSLGKYEYRSVNGIKSDKEKIKAKIQDLEWSLRYRKSDLTYSKQAIGGHVLRGEDFQIEVARAMEIQAKINAITLEIEELKGQL
jgi:hypothetical protein